jgi:hypothetical protein
MEKSYLLDVLRTFSTEEWNELMDFAVSPFFTRGKLGEEAKTLLSLLRKAAPEFKPNKIKKEEIYKKIYPGEGWKEGRIEKCMAELNKICKIYLITKQTISESNGFIFQLNYAKILRSRNLKSRYEQIISKINSNNNISLEKNSDFYLNQFFLEIEKYDFESYYNAHRGHLNIPESIYSLEVYYLIKKSELVIHLLMQSNAVKINVPQHYISDLLQNAQFVEYTKDIPILDINYKILHVLSKKNPEYSDVIDLNNLIIKYEPFLKSNILRTINAYLRNICVIIGVANSSNEFKSFVFQLRKNHLYKGYLYYEGKLPTGALFNFVILGLRLKEFQWVNEIIESHKDLIIGENETHDYYRLAKSFYFFSTGAYADALDIIPLTFTESIYTDLARSLELKIYYETNSDLLSYKIDAFKMYVNRTAQKYATNQEYQLQMTFVNMLRQLTNSTPGKRKRAEQIIQRIQNKKLIAERDWLIQKARELGNITE